MAIQDESEWTGSRYQDVEGLQGKIHFIGSADWCQSVIYCPVSDAKRRQVKRFSITRIY
jgi:hypothetical protein